MNGLLRRFPHKWFRLAVVLMLTAAASISSADVGAEGGIPIFQVLQSVLQGSPARVLMRLFWSVFWGVAAVVVFVLMLTLVAVFSAFPHIRGFLIDCAFAMGIPTTVLLISAVMSHSEGGVRVAWAAVAALWTMTFLVTLRRTGNWRVRSTLYCSGVLIAVWFPVVMLMTHTSDMSLLAYDRVRCAFGVLFSGLFWTADVLTSNGDMPVR
jgi:hypothetical protein